MLNLPVIDRKTLLFLPFHRAEPSTVPRPLATSASAEWRDAVGFGLATVVVGPGRVVDA